jgi:succinate-semialdehyde dehydrogenase/glutarate-semialdehyde dehydrogenase
MPSSSSGKRLFTIRQPVGVVAAITPWNFPISMITRKVAPALAAGCTCVVKPASETPLTALLLAEMAEEAGFPDGVLNIITGDAKVIGEQLLADERVAKITFTGSTAVGKVIMAQAADTVKRISLELGGHAPIIVHDDADIHMAVMETVNNKFRNAGQTCICANRVYVHASIFDDFEKALTEEVTKLQVGNGLEEGVDIGPLINKDGFEQVKQHVDQAVSLGAKVVTGGRQIMVEGNEGYFYEPTVITQVTQGMKILKEETFGPVVPIIPFHTDEEAVRLANDTPYGLAAYIFTTNINRAIYTAEHLEYGIIGINDGAPSAAELPFGGMKQSGFGREGGREGIDMYLETKSISLGGL